MTIEIVCETSTDKLEQLEDEFETVGFVPISMINKVVDNRNLMCILMYKKEYVKWYTVKQ